MSNPSNPTPTPVKAEPETTVADRLSFAALTVVMVVTYVWFFSQALPHTS